MKPYRGTTLVFSKEYKELVMLLTGVSQSIASQPIHENSSIIDDSDKGSYIVTVTYKHSDYCECEGWYHRDTCQHYTPTF